MALLKSINEDEFRALVKCSISISEVIKKTGLKAAGANFRGFHILIKRWDVDTSHFLGQAACRGKPNKGAIALQIPLDQILVEYSTYNSNSLRKRLLKSKIFEARCVGCKNTTWMGKPIPLELEHKNGINTDNRIENLELLCPNCHSFTSTYRGRNKKKRGIGEMVDTPALGAGF